MRSPLTTRLLASVFLLSCPLGLTAQQLEEVIVTAQKRSREPAGCADLYCRGERC